ncbi:MAG: Dna2/Cas4 domain-containing protein, partial [Halobacteria archaeon]|nr:Dna2/Cas4 domain-containing protein [Halobacteria archaeon]
VGLVPPHPQFHIARIRSAAYCERQAYYEMRRENDQDFEPSTETRVLHHLAYLYDSLLDEPEEALTTALKFADSEDDRDELDIDIRTIVRGLRRTRDTFEYWDAVVRPYRQEMYLETPRLHGTLDKIVETHDGYVPSIVKTGEPPRNGVWSSERLEATAVWRIIDAHYPSPSRVFVEYPRTGEIRVAEIDRRDRRRLEKLLESLEEARKGHPPSRTSNPSKCDACEFQEECGVKTTSLLSRLRRWTGTEG